VQAILGVDIIQKGGGGGGQKPDFWTFSVDHGNLGGNNRFSKRGLSNGVHNHRIDYGLMVMNYYLYIGKKYL
jgi:hypothetical protein